MPSLAHSGTIVRLWILGLQLDSWVFSSMMSCTSLRNVHIPLPMTSLEMAGELEGIHLLGLEMCCCLSRADHGNRSLSFKTSEISCGARNSWPGCSQVSEYSSSGCPPVSKVKKNHDFLLIIWRECGSAATAAVLWCVYPQQRHCLYCLVYTYIRSCMYLRVLYSCQI